MRRERRLDGGDTLARSRKAWMQSMFRKRKFIPFHLDNDFYNFS